MNNARVVQTHSEFKRQIDAVAQANMFQGMVQGANIVTGSSFVAVAVVGNEDLAIEDSDGNELVRVLRTDVLGLDKLCSWFREVWVDHLNNGRVGFTSVPRRPTGPLKPPKPPYPREFG